MTTTVAMMSGVLLASTLTSNSTLAQVMVHEVPLTSCAQNSPLSRDGTTVAGQTANGTAGLWRIGASLEELGPFCARSVSESLACGQGTLAGGNLNVAYLWTPVDGLVAIPSPTNQPVQARATSGGRVVGSIGSRAAFLDVAGSHVLIPGLASDYDSSASAISCADYQSYVIGIVNSWTGYRGFVHSFAIMGSPDSTEVLNSPDGGPCAVSAVSTYGNFVVGEIPLPGSSFSFSLANQACLWTRVSASGPYQPEPLRHPPGMQRSDAFGVSRWAEVIAGTCYRDNGGYRATLWRGAHRPIDLQRYLTSMGVGTSVPTLTAADAVSDDGRTILARAGAQYFLITGFTMPSTPLTDLNWDGHTNGVDLGLLLAQWGAPPAGSASDIDLNGTVDGRDLASLLANWGPSF